MHSSRGFFAASEYHIEAAFSIWSVFTNRTKEKDYGNAKCYLFRPLEGSQDLEL